MEPPPIIVYTLKNPTGRCSCYPSSRNSFDVRLARQVDEAAALCVRAFDGGKILQADAQPGTFAYSVMFLAFYSKIYS